MKLDEATFSSTAWVLDVGSAMMIASDYYGELVITSDLTPRWACWLASIAFFLYIVLRTPVISWCTYPVEYLFPMLGVEPC